MAALFQEAGYEIVDFHEKADVYVINTCTVTHLSDRKSRQMIRRAAHENPEAAVVVCGCYAQTAAGELAGLEEVDLIIGTNERHRVVEAVEEFRNNHQRKTYLSTEEDLFYYEDLPHERVSGMTRAYVKVQEGCDQFCAYCIIPYARGPLRSRSEADTVAEINALVAKGYKEVILTGIHLGAYGRGVKDETTDLTGLCKRILEETNIERLRLGSLEGIEVTDELINIINEVCEEALKAEEVNIPYQISLLFVDNEEIREINRETRGIDKATDVLSFPMLEYPKDKVFKEVYKDTKFNEIYLDGDELVLGDMVLSLERAKEQSIEYNHSFNREVCYLVVHSILHLLGYDHMEDEEKKRMRKREEEILGSLNITR